MLILQFVSQFVCSFVCMFVCFRVLGHTSEGLVCSFFSYKIVIVRIEKDRISTKLIAFSHKYDHFSYLQ